MFVELGSVAVLFMLYEKLMHKVRIWCLINTLLRMCHFWHFIPLKDSFGLLWGVLLVTYAKRALINLFDPIININNPPYGL